MKFILLHLVRNSVCRLVEFLELFLSSNVLEMWKFATLFEHNIHLPDITSPVFHCQAKLGPFDPPLQKLVTAGALHPTVQFSNPDLAFFKYPNVHLKIKLLGPPTSLEGASSTKGSVRSILDGVYPTPPKALLGNMTAPNGSPTWSSLDFRNAMSHKNLSLPGHVEMKRICMPPDSVVRRLLVTAVPADSNGNDVLDGPVGYGVYNVKHQLPWGYRGVIANQLNRNVAFF